MLSEREFRQIKTAFEAMESYRFPNESEYIMLNNALAILAQYVEEVRDAPEPSKPTSYWVKAGSSEVPHRFEQKVEQL